MKEIQLTQGKVALVDDEDFEYLNQRKWCARKHRNTFYATTSEWINKKSQNISMHRLILDGCRKQIDHADSNGLNNQKYNLRRCTSQENNRNRKPYLGKSSIYKGVSFSKNIYRAQISINRKPILLGRFSLEIEAAKAYDEAAKLYFKEFAYLNFP